MGSTNKVNFLGSCSRLIMKTPDAVHEKAEEDNLLRLNFHSEQISQKKEIYFLLINFLDEMFFPFAIKCRI